MRKAEGGSKPAMAGKAGLVPGVVRTRRNRGHSRALCCSSRENKSRSRSEGGKTASSGRADHVCKGDG